MIDVQVAAKKAAEYLRSFFPKATAIQLEEVELLDSKTHWMITLSYSLEQTPSYVFSIERKFKLFKIEANSGEVVAMKIKDVK